jgi:mannose-6-phosphate isomerase-like protein (cupin superfamily)
MRSIQISKEEMLKRVARFKELEPSRYAFVDTAIPGHERLIYNVIGKGVTEDPSLNPAIADSRDFNVTFVETAPGKGAALHSHSTVEVFIALSSKWSIYWGDNGESEIVLEPWDTISVPVGVMRGFRNVGDGDGYLMAILGGSDAGRVAWAPTVLERAKATGLELDQEGNVIRKTL